MRIGSLATESNSIAERSEADAGVELSTMPAHSSMLLKRSSEPREQGKSDDRLDEFDGSFEHGRRVNVEPEAMQKGREHGAVVPLEVPAIRMCPFMEKGRGRLAAP